MNLLVKLPDLAGNIISMVAQGDDLVVTTESGLIYVLRKHEIDIAKHTDNPILLRDLP